MLKHIAFISFLSFSWSYQALAATPEQRLKSFLAKATTLQADFTQVQVDEKGNLGKRSTGVFYLQRPGKFRWNYQKPYNQEIVSGAGKVWFYDKDLEQVTAKKLTQAIGSTPALLLTGEVPLEQNFTIENQSDLGLCAARGGEQQHGRTRAQGQDQIGGISGRGEREPIQHQFVVGPDRVAYRPAEESDGQRRPCGPRPAPG